LDDLHSSTVIKKEETHAASLADDIGDARQPNMSQQLAEVKKEQDVYDVAGGGAAHGSAQPTHEHTVIKTEKIELALHKGFVRECPPQDTPGPVAFEDMGECSCHLCSHERVWRRSIKRWAMKVALAAHEHRTEGDQE
jgi:hypothetical protein